MSKKDQLLTRFRDAASSAGLTISSDGIVCPLCWFEVSAADATVEHIVPGAVGGSRCVLTCRSCNNKHGSNYDSQVAAFARSANAVRGAGKIPIEIIAGESRAAANIRFDPTDNPARIFFDIVGKASNPADVKTMQDAAAAGNLTSFELKLPDSSKHRFHLGLVRSAYLAVFDKHGYAPLQQDEYTALRKSIIDVETPSAFRIRTFVGELRASAIDLPFVYKMLHCKHEGDDFLMVLIRLKQATQSLMFVNMPMPGRTGGDFFGRMERLSKEGNGKTLLLPAQALIG